MRRTNLPGHALRAEGKAVAPHRTRNYELTGQRVGRAMCQCGERSPRLDSDYKRKAWHRDHKAAVRAARDSTDHSTETQQTETPMPDDSKIPEHLTAIRDEAQVLVADILPAAGRVTAVQVTEGDGFTWSFDPESPDTVTSQWGTSQNGRAEIFYERGGSCFRIELTEVPF